MDVWEVPCSSCSLVLTEASSWMDVGPFLKEPVKQKRSSFGFLRSGSAPRSCLFLLVGLLVTANRVQFIVALAVIVFGFVSVVVASLREIAIVLFRGDCSQHIPSRGTAHANGEQLCLVIRLWQMRIYLVRIPRRKGHSIQSIVRPGLVISH